MHKTIGRFLNFQKLGINRGTPRVWIESARMGSLGFGVGESIQVIPSLQGLRIRRSPRGVASRIVSGRMIGGLQRPIIDIENGMILRTLKGCGEIRIRATFGNIEVSPSIRAFHIRNQLSSKNSYRVLEVFAGGGLLSGALVGNSTYSMVGGVEVNSTYADIWQAAHPNADIYLGDIRSIHTSEYPKFDILIGGIPCTAHSNLGRAKHGLAGKPELGECGDLFLSVISLISQRLPSACLFENVPSFGSSLAGQLLTTHLQKLGYSICETILEPNKEWGEISDRRRWVMIATLKPGFKIQTPMMPCSRLAADFLDHQDDNQDRLDCERIAKTISGLQAHFTKHKALGHGFGMSVIDGSENRLPTITRSYHKISSGPFVKTKYGLRLLRKAELERIMGAQIDTSSFAVATEIMGQGVQPGIFKQIFEQLASFLATNSIKCGAEIPRQQSLVFS